MKRLDMTLGSLNGFLFLFFFVSFFNLFICSIPPFLREIKARHHVYSEVLYGNFIRNRLARLSHVGLLDFPMM